MADGATPEVPREVNVSDWVGALAEGVAAGWDHLEFLTAVDWPTADQIEVVACLRAVPGDGDSPALGPPTWLASCRVARSSPRIASATSVVAGADWYEREIHEMFGVDFVGHPDQGPLLLDGSAAELGVWPLRRTEPLTARLEVPWPGAADPADRPAAGRPARGHSRQVTPGNNPEWEVGS
jgi:NADH-quinone oxidoreductase subunit C